MRTGSVKLSVILFSAMLMITACLTVSFVNEPSETPVKWPEPAHGFSFADLDSVQVQLGRKLFYDPILSADSTISCASCHLSYTAFTHVDHALSHGINDSVGRRNSPVLINLAWNESFMWDGAINHLEVQGLAPITHAAEMGETLEHVLQKLNRHSQYPKRFQDAFGVTEIRSKQLLVALAQFQFTLVSQDSKYDQVMRGEKHFTEQEASGYRLFRTHCGGCHTEPLFTNASFENNGLPLDSTLMDFGRSEITGRAADQRKFKVPTLRNIGYSQPYMHDGRFESLSEVLKHYTSGIEHSSTLDAALSKGVHLSERDRVDVVAFLLTLSDTKFLRNPNFSFPRE